MTTRRSLATRAGAHALALLVTASLGLGCSDDAQLVSEHLAAAAAHEEAGEAREAVLELRSALRLAPQDADINLRLARLSQRNGNLSDALFYFEEVRRLDPDDSEAAIGIIALVQATDLERAREEADLLVEKDPTNPLAHLAASGVALVEEDVDAALTSALTAVELDPEAPAVHLQLGLVHEANVRAHHMAKQNVPEDVYTSAIAAFRRTRELATTEEEVPTRLRAWMEEAKTYARWPGHREELRAVTAEAYEDLHGAEDQIRRVLVQASLGLGRQLRDVELIRWSLERSVELDPRDFRAWGDLALMEAQAEDRGMGVLDRMIAQLPDDGAAHALYARRLAQLGRAEEAIAYLEGAIGKLEASSADLGHALARLANLQVGAGDLEAAAATRDRLDQEAPGSIHSFSARAVVAQAEGDTEAAREALQSWIEASESLVAMRMLGLLELQRGNAKAALEVADRSVEVARREGERQRPYLCIRGMALMRLGQRQAGMRALALARRSAGAPVAGCRVAYAEALYASGRDEQAFEALEPLVEQGQREAVLVFARREGENQPKRARALLEQGLEARPSDAVFLGRLVQMDLAEGDGEAAVARARAAAEAYPDSPGMNLILGRVLATTRANDEAVAVLEKTLERWPSVPGTSASLLDLLRRLGRLEEARDTFERLYAEGSLAPGSQVMLARLRNRGGDEAGAVELLEAALATEPDLTAAANDLAYLLAVRGDDLERATELAQVARGQEPESPSIADTLGWVFQQRGLHNAALVQFEEAIELADPQSPAWATANFHRALALRELDRGEEAITAVERALASGTDFPEAEQAREIIRELSAAATDES